jgi:hypothetical protein
MEIAERLAACLSNQRQQGLSKAQVVRERMIEVDEVGRKLRRAAVGAFSQVNCETSGTERTSATRGIAREALIHISTPIRIGSVALKIPSRNTSCTRSLLKASPSYLLTLHVESPRSPEGQARRRRFISIRVPVTIQILSYIE